MLNGGLRLFNVPEVIIDGIRFLLSPRRKNASKKQWVTVAVGAPYIYSRYSLGSGRSLESLSLLRTRRSVKRSEGANGCCGKNSPFSFFFSPFVKEKGIARLGTNSQDRTKGKK
jgi:hypothetical protein